MSWQKWIGVATEAARFGRGQHPRELAQLLDVVDELQPSVVLEIGTRQGGTLWAFARAAPDAVLVSVDPTNERRFLQQLVGLDRELHLITGRSQDPASLIAVERVLDARPVDFLFIDGSHLADDVAADVRLYGPLLSPQGLAGLHDIVLRSPETHADVQAVWGPLSALPGSFEIVDPDAVPPMGIGVVTARALSADAEARRAGARAAGAPA